MTKAVLQRDGERALRPDRALLDAVERGLCRVEKRLPAWLFYDARGSELFEQITELPEYYLTRAEREIFETRADEIVAIAADGQSAALRVVELGAGTATKSQVLLRAVVRRQSRCLYVPVDVSGAALEVAQERLEREEPRVEVKPLVVPHSIATTRLRHIARTRFVLFIGSSIGNFEEHEAVELLRAVRRGLSAGDVMLLGADRKKSTELVLPAYDDASGVTAAFNLNVLARLNRELGADFDVEAFRHVALWNEQRARVEMHLESVEAQRVTIAALGREVSFARGERIHTESSHKYTEESIDDMLARAGFLREQSFTDAGELFGVHVARAVGAD